MSSSASTYKEGRTPDFISNICFLLLMVLSSNASRVFCHRADDRVFKEVSRWNHGQGLVFATNLLEHAAVKAENHSDWSYFNFIFGGAELKPGRELGTEQIR